MGSPNNGPFSYISGSLQLYAEALNYHADSSSLIKSEVSSSKSDFIKSISKIDPAIMKEAMSFAKRTGSSYINYRYDVHENGLHVLRATKPGDVPGSYAEYIKFLYKDGTIRAVFKDTVDNKGNKIHRHIKWPRKEL